MTKLKTFLVLSALAVSAQSMDQEKFDDEEESSARVSADVNSSYRKDLADVERRSSAESLDVLKSRDKGLRHHKSTKEPNLWLWHAVSDEIASSSVALSVKDAFNIAEDIITKKMTEHPEKKEVFQKILKNLTEIKQSCEDIELQTKIQPNDTHFKKIHSAWILDEE